MWIAIATSALGVLVALVAAEVAFGIRDDWAFPHLNAYIADSKLGVRLRPSSQGRVRVARGTVSSYRINSHGYRGDEWSPPRADEILVVGDSQTFGLGVNEGESFVDEVGRSLRRPVINAGVPTYGPPEYLAVAKEIIAKRRSIRTLVYVISASNDLFERNLPNVTRHAVWDGWAVRKETAPREVTSFPGRDWLFNRSHAFFAGRKWLHRAELTPAAGFASEGSWRDVVATQAQSEHRRQQTRAELAQRANELQVQLGKARLAESNYLFEVLDAGQREPGVCDELPGYPGERAGYGYDARAVAEATPGDIVSLDYGEESEDITLAAAYIREAGRYIANCRLATERKRKDQLERYATERATSLSELDAVAALPTVQPPPLQFEDVVTELRIFGEANHVEVVVLLLPIDVVVSPAEWDKYKNAGPRPDLGAIEGLGKEIMEAAYRNRLRALDATAALRAAGPGMYIIGDPHLNAAGHRVVAAALAETLRTPLAPAFPTPGLPSGRSHIPTPAEWLHAPQARASVSIACAVQSVREWVRLSCRNRTNVRRARPGADVVAAMKVLAANNPEALALATPQGGTLVAPVLGSDPLVAQITFTSGLAFEVRFVRTRGAAQSIVTTLPRVDPAPTKPPATRACECGGDDVCRELYGVESPECVATYGESCSLLHACMRGDPAVAPPCERGTAPSFTTNVCRPLCDAMNPCSRGTCVPWQGTGFCVAPDMS